MSLDCLSCDADNVPKVESTVMGWDALLEAIVEGKLKGQIAIALRFRGTTLDGWEQERVSNSQTRLLFEGSTGDHSASPIVSLVMSARHSRIFYRVPEHPPLFNANLLTPRTFLFAHFNACRAWQLQNITYGPRRASDSARAFCPFPCGHWQLGRFRAL
jgi:hypothetical protein